MSAITTSNYSRSLLKSRETGIFLSLKRSASLDITFHAITPERARALATWRYPAPYDTYNIGNEPAALAEMLDARSPWFVALDAAGVPMGYCCFGTAAEVGWDGEPRLWTTDDQTLSVGLGLRPDLTGQHLGLPFVNAVLAFAAERFAPDALRLFVLPFNARAIRVYECAGFQRTGEIDVNNSNPAERLFLEMRREAAQKPGGKSVC